MFTSAKWLSLNSMIITLEFLHFVLVELREYNSCFIQTRHNILLWKKSYMVRANNAAKLRLLHGSFGKIMAENISLFLGMINQMQHFWGHLYTVQWSRNLSLIRMSAFQEVTKRADNSSAVYTLRLENVHLGCVSMIIN